MKDSPESVETSIHAEPPSRSSSTSESSTSAYGDEIEHLQAPSQHASADIRRHTTHDSHVDGNFFAPITSCTDGGVLAKSGTRATVGTQGAETDFEVDFEDSDPGNPMTWAFWYKGWIIGSVSYSTATVVLYSTSYTSAIPGIMAEFHVESQTTAVLGVTTYLLGLAVGSVLLAPLSEMYGRRPIYLIAMLLFGLLVLPCSLAQNLEAILVTRFFGAIAGSAMISNAPGTVNDIVEEDYRAMAFSIWSIGPMNGPVLGPLVGGFAYQYLGWRWTNWIVLICSGVAFLSLCTIKETYAPEILRSRAAKKRKETGNQRWASRYDDQTAFWPLLRLNLSRPFIITVTEPICIFWDIYIAVIYGILYLCFVAYPYVFSNLRHWTPGFVGLAFSGIGIGSLLVIGLEPMIRRMINAHEKDPETGKPPPEAMVSMVCIAAILIPVGELMFAWTCTPNVHWIVPIIAGVPFGAGNTAVFIYASTYLVHSYGIYAASALAGNSVFRSVLGGTLPLAGPLLYDRLGPNWAGTFLGLLEVLLAPIPFIFYRYGHKIRMKSTLIRQMTEDRKRLETRMRKREARQQRKIATEKAESEGLGKEVYLSEKEESRPSNIAKDLETDPSSNGRLVKAIRSSYGSGVNDFEVLGVMVVLALSATTQ
ncbi:MFS general substrate transporter [Eremomyces bilateralis CBS 781.70]|uniref:MFS general substrate transporter n=1 Tax=Eremomyces bilateralis CBS 781.70 TaxID=1392243 RepID=A0A6G1FVT6_9PEZI|nr:MFS general substrate transporter [Eremomyces bilateralis CBS 781.70]KAF1809781.1 MFS general substrate transporter [Eremomyces bilateralis CBS 781.70]